MRKGIDCRGREWCEFIKPLSPDKDLTGKIFGKLKVQFRVQNDSQGNSFWLTSCQCGNEIVVKGVSLRNGHTTSCGCVQRDNASKKLTKEFLPNEQIGYWTILYKADGYLGKGAYWHVKCKCGTEKDVSAESLRNGSSLSCGCLHKELTRKANLIDLTGQKFGLLTVLGLSDEQPAGDVHWRVRCDCGNEKNVSGHSMKKGNTLSCGCLKQSIGEMNIEKILVNNCVLFDTEYVFLDLISECGTHLRFDFAIFDKNQELLRLIEYDGEQHYWPIDYFGGQEAFERLKKNDCLKNQYTLSHNIPLVRIPYSKRDIITLEDLLGDKYLIKGEN